MREALSSRAEKIVCEADDLRSRGTCCWPEPSRRIGLTYIAVIFYSLPAAYRFSGNSPAVSGITSFLNKLPSRSPENEAQKNKEKKRNSIMLSVSNVSMRYGAKILFDEVSTAFTPGKRYGLTGPNGAGKSTFMKLLSGEIEPQKGTVVRPRKVGVLGRGSVCLRRLHRHRHRHHGQQAPLGRHAGTRCDLRESRHDRRRWYEARRT